MHLVCVDSGLATIMKFSDMLLNSSFNSGIKAEGGCKVSKSWAWVGGALSGGASDQLLSLWYL